MMTIIIIWKRCVVGQQQQHHQRRKHTGNIFKAVGNITEITLNSHSHNNSTDNN